MSAVPLLSVLGLPGMACGQSQPRVQETEWVNDASMAAVNAAIGGVIAGVRRAIGGRSFWPAARDGALGGLVSYAGMRIGSAGFAGHRWLARDVAAVGIAMSSNASEGQPMFSRLYFPIGPLALEWNRSASGRAWGLSVNVHDVFAIGYGVLHPDLSFNWPASLASGYPVFEARDSYLLRDGADGRADGGVVLIERRNEAARQRIFDHELVHVIQTEQFNRLAGNPLEAWLLGRLPGGDRVPGWIHPSWARDGFSWCVLNFAPISGYRTYEELEAQWIEFH